MQWPMEVSIHLMDCWESTQQECLKCTYRVTCLGHQEEQHQTVCPMSVTCILLWNRTLSGWKTRPSQQNIKCLLGSTHTRTLHQLAPPVNHYSSPSSVFLVGQGDGYRGYGIVPSLIWNTCHIAGTTGRTDLTLNFTQTNQLPIVA